MSRPCFALSVMLCCLAGPLLVIGKAQARDSVVSPSHDPGECIVCPLAHGSQEVCGGYSDYDYNQYWHDSPPTVTSEPPAQSDPELEVAQTLTDDSASGAWGAEYEDYYADYVFGEESTTATEAEPVSVGEATIAEGTANYEAYEEEWFAYGAETTVDNDVETDEAYEALTESEGESNPSEISNAGISEDAWGDEEEWYQEQYGEAASGSASLRSEEQLETGYDESYDDVMTSQPEATEPVAEIVPTSDDYEPFYNAYDDLYNFEASSLEPSEDGSSVAEVASVVKESGEQTSVSEPGWLTDLVTRLLAPVWTATGSIASEQWTLVPHVPTTAIYVDQCAQEWDCEADYWAQPQADQPSLVLDAADTLDGMASLLRNAAEALRGFANRDIEEMARKTGGNSPH